MPCGVAGAALQPVTVHHRKAVAGEAFTVDLAELAGVLLRGDVTRQRSAAGGCIRGVTACAAACEALPSIRDRAKARLALRAIHTTVTRNAGSTDGSAAGQRPKPTGLRSGRNRGPRRARAPKSGPRNGEQRNGPNSSGAMTVQRDEWKPVPRRAGEREGRTCLGSGAERIPHTFRGIVIPPTMRSLRSHCMWDRPDRYPSFSHMRRLSAEHRYSKNRTCCH